MAFTGIIEHCQRKPRILANVADISELLYTLQTTSETASGQGGAQVANQTPENTNLQAIQTVADYPT